MYANAHRDPKRGRDAKPSDYNPYLKKKTARVENLSELKVLFDQGGVAGDEALSMDLTPIPIIDSDSEFGIAAENGSEAGER